MDFESIVYFLLIAGAIQGFGFNLVTIFVKKKFEKLIIFLNLTVLFISLNNLQAWLRYNDYISDLFLLMHFRVPWYALIFPMFYAFTAYYLRIEDKVNDFLKLSVGIFVVELLIRAGLIGYIYYQAPDQVNLIASYTNVEEIVNLLYSLFLFVNATLLIFRRHELLNFIMAYDDLNWIKWFIRLGAFVMLIWMVTVYIWNMHDQPSVYYILNLSSSIVLYWVGYQGFYKYNVVQDRISLRSSLRKDRMLISTSQVESTTSDNNDFFNEKHQSDFEKIKSLVIDQKLYLDPLLNVDTVIHALGFSKSYLSKLINSYSQYNFSDFINSLRVEQAKKFLSDPEFGHYTNVSIGLECGFNSKSTFYSAFRKFTSLTPTEFKAKYA